MAPYVAAFGVCTATPLHGALWHCMGHPRGVTWDARYHRTAQKRPWSQLALPARTKQARASATESCLTGPQQWQAINHSIKLSSSSPPSIVLPRPHKHKYRIQNLGHSLRIGSQPRATERPRIQYQPPCARPRPRGRADKTPLALLATAQPCHHRRSRARGMRQPHAPMQGMT